jgi:hypothetical protein
MATLTIDDKTARKIYPTAAPELKAILEDSYSKQFFSGKIIDRILSMEDVCAEKGISINDSRYTMGDPDDIAFRMVKDFTEVLNEGWKPNWNDGNERKWFIWWLMDAPGFRLYDIHCYWTNSCTSAGSRLCFKSEELARHAAKVFQPIYKQLMTI